MFSFNVSELLLYLCSIPFTQNNSNNDLKKYLGQENTACILKSIALTNLKPLIHYLHWSRDHKGQICFHSLKGFSVHFLYVTKCRWLIYSLDRLPDAVVFHGFIPLNFRIFRVTHTFHWRYKIFTEIKGETKPHHLLFNCCRNYLCIAMIAVA